MPAARKKKRRRREVRRGGESTNKKILSYATHNYDTASCHGQADVCILHLHCISSETLVLVHLSDVFQHLILGPEGLPAHVALVTGAKVLALHVSRHVLPTWTLLVTRAAPVDSRAAVPRDKRVDARRRGRIQRQTGVRGRGGGGRRVHSQMRGGGGAVACVARVGDILPEIVVEEEVV